MTLEFKSIILTGAVFFKLIGCVFGKNPFRNHSRSTLYFCSTSGLQTREVLENLNSGAIC